ncbi:hypothetical protein Btru_067433 [Bulinus truncatus]|nr:hypothetical protein Btru_067433 [Bulinus truncatus]
MVNQHSNDSSMGNYQHASKRTGTLQSNESSTHLSTPLLNEAVNENSKLDKDSRRVRSCVKASKNLKGNSSSDTGSNTHRSLNESQASSLNKESTSDEDVIE